MLEELNKPYEMSEIRVSFALGEWSPCSQLECGKPDGAQVRMIKCQLHLRQMVNYLEEDVCEAFGLVRQPATRACSNPECPRWEASDWSECEGGLSRCVRHRTALQRRDVKCVYANGTDADVPLCDRKSRPKIKKECENRELSSHLRPA
jgi:Thrombospondin type 1 domain